MPNMPWGALNEDFTEWLIGGRVFFCTQLLFLQRPIITTLTIYSLFVRINFENGTKRGVFRLKEWGILCFVFVIIDQLFPLIFFFIFLCNAKFVPFIEWKETETSNWNSTLINSFQIRALSMFILWREIESYENPKKSTRK